MRIGNGMERKHLFGVARCDLGYGMLIESFDEPVSRIVISQCRCSVAMQDQVLVGSVFNRQGISLR